MGLAREGKLPVVGHCISWANISDGIAFGGGANIVFRFNTTGRNAVGFRHQSDTTSENNLSFRDTTVSDVEDVQANNSWNPARAEPSFMSDSPDSPDSPDFLRPEPRGAFDDIGADGE